MGWGYWGAWVFASGYVTLGFGGYLHALTGLPPIPGALALIAVSTALHLRGARVAGRAEAAVLVLGMGVLVAVGLLGLPQALAHAARFVPFLPRGLGGVAAATPAAFLALNGFDSVAAAGEEIARPERTLPRAILLTLLIAIVLYLLVTAMAVGALPWPALGASPVPLADAAATFLGPAGRLLVAVAALLTMAATANAVLVVGSRVAFGMARDGELPGVAGRVSAGRGTPWVAVLLTGAALALVAVAGSATLAASVGGFLYAVHFAFPVAALVRLRRGGPTPAFRTPAPRVILPLAGVACGLLLGASGQVGVAGGLSWLLIGLVLHLAGRAVAARGTGVPRSRGGRRMTMDARTRGGGSAQAGARAAAMACSGENAVPSAHAASNVSAATDALTAVRVRS
jgi:APA family basic amino acid/polyamine antiporter